MCIFLRTTGKSIYWLSVQIKPMADCQQDQILHFLIIGWYHIIPPKNQWKENQEIEGVINHYKILSLIVSIINFTSSSVTQGPDGRQSPRLNIDSETPFTYAGTFL